MEYKYFMTSDLGGGGQTVSRLPRYLKEIQRLGKVNIGILLNYHYLTFFEKTGQKKTQRPVFDKQSLQKLNNTNLNFYDFFDLFNSSDDQKLETNIFDIILDSGSGKILADSVLFYSYDKNQCVRHLKSLVADQLKFASEKGSKYVIAMDYCKKLTYKNQEGRSDEYNKIISELLLDKNYQNELLTYSLEEAEKYENINIFAPIHGKDGDSFFSHYSSIRELEIRNNKEFNGFALGGLGNFSAGKIGEIVSQIRNTDEKRDIHILGSSGLNKIIPLVMGGANFFDCHTPWRRANDKEHKFVVPLLDKDLNLISNKDAFTNQDLEITVTHQGFNCNCDICQNYPINEIERLVNNRNNNSDDYYFGIILIYFHAVYQYSYLLRKLKQLNSPDNIRNFIDEIYDAKLKEKLTKEVEFID